MAHIIRAGRGTETCQGTTGVWKEYGERNFRGSPTLGGQKIGGTRLLGWRINRTTASYRRWAKDECVDELKSQLEKTDFSVNTSMLHLQQIKYDIANTFGMDVGRALAAIVHTKGGTNGLRSRIWDLCQLSPEEAQKAARGILADIVNFNRELDKVHELIRPKSTSTRTRKKKA
jgi:hypothetical protein